MNQALSFAAARQLFLKCPKQLRGDRLELEIRVIDNAAAALYAIATLAAQAIGKQPASLGQRMLSRGRNLGKRQAAIAPGDDMTRGGDVEPGFEFAPFYGSRFMNVEQLGVQGTAEQLKRELGDFRAYR